MENKDVSLHLQDSHTDESKVVFEFLKFENFNINVIRNSEKANTEKPASGFLAILGDASFSCIYDLVHFISEKGKTHECSHK